MIPTLAYYLDTRRSLKTGKYPLKLRVTFDRESRYHRTKFSFEEDEYDRLMNGKRLTDEQVKIRNQLSKFMRKCEDLIDEMDVFDFTTFENKLTGKGDRMELIFRLKEIEDEFRSRQKIGTAQIYASASKSFKLFANSDKIPLKSITTQWMKKYEEWMKGIGNTDTTINFYGSKIRKVFNDSIKLGELKGVVSPFFNGAYKIPKSAKTNKSFPIEEVMLIYNYKPTVEKQQYAKDMFFLSYFSGGMNMADLFNLKWKDIKKDSFSFIRQKTVDTSATLVTIKITEEIRDILERRSVRRIDSNYVFPLYQDNWNEETRLKHRRLEMLKIGYHMKNITKAIGLGDEIGTGWARHMYATVLMNEEVPLAYISKQLGHENLATTQNYLDSFTKKKTEEYSAKLLDKSTG